MARNVNSLVDFTVAEAVISMRADVERLQAVPDQSLQSIMDVCLIPPVCFYLTNQMTIGGLEKTVPIGKGTKLSSGVGCSCG